MVRVFKSVLRPIVRAFRASSLFVRVWIVAARYKQRKIELGRRLRSGKKLRVLFLVSEAEKWKEQTLFDAMRASGVFEPLIGVSCRADWWNHPEYIDIFNGIKDFFLKKRMDYVELADFSTMMDVPLQRFSPDIVVYTQPYDWRSEYLPYAVSRYALTCYIPYYVPTQMALPNHYGLELHRTVTWFFEINERWVKLYKSLMKPWMYCAEIIGKGNPFMDFYSANKSRGSGADMVIYAPHWSFDHPGNVNGNNLSTFLWNGREILSYAKQHKEMKWVFKPHPGLYWHLIQSGAWTKEESDSYFAEWWSFALKCEGSDYYKLFERSRALITDCASFLAEYPPCGGAMIHLISSTCKDPPNPIQNQMYDTFYKVHNLEEMERVFDDVLVKGLDPNRDVRMKAVRELNLIGNNAAENILKHISDSL